MWSDILKDLQQRHTARTAQLIMNSLRNSTQRQYATYISKFTTYTNKNVTNCSLHDLLGFLEHLYYDCNLGYSAVNTARSAISTVLEMTSGEALGQNKLVVRFMKGVFNARPTQPKYMSTWNPDTLLSYLDCDSKTLTLIQFSRKVATLITLLSAQRVATIAAIKLQDIREEGNGIVILPSALGKTSRPGFINSHIKFQVFPEKPHVCIVSQLKLYLERSASLRDTSHYNKTTNNLFITTTKPYRNASKNTISNWIKETLHSAGIPYTPHSIRSASTSRAQANMSVDDILKAAGWSEESTFRRFYKREVSKTPYFNANLLRLYTDSDQNQEASI